jgi:hypothetical protein
MSLEAGKLQIEKAKDRLFVGQLKSPAVMRKTYAFAQVKASLGEMMILISYLDAIIPPVSERREDISWHFAVGKSERLPLLESNLHLHILYESLYFPNRLWIVLLCSRHESIPHIPTDLPEIEINEMLLLHTVAVESFLPTLYRAVVQKE